MRIQPGQLVALGYGAYVRSDEVTAVEPIIDGRGPGRRSQVWVRDSPCRSWLPGRTVRSSTIWSHLTTRPPA